MSWHKVLAAVVGLATLATIVYCVIELGNALESV